uniref:ZP domain-containing protein n=1 Tax=Ditylenchus dipsaci TaxID=166011 RepID=A0A915E6H7_9BILA
MLWSVSKCLIAVLLGACLVNVFALEVADPPELKVTSPGSDASINVDEQNINFEMVYPSSCLTETRSDNKFRMEYGGCGIGFKLDDGSLYFEDEAPFLHRKHSIDVTIDLKNSAISFAQKGSPVKIDDKHKPQLTCKPNYKEGSNLKAMDVSASGTPNCDIKIKFKNQRYDPKSSTEIPSGGHPVASAGLGAGAWAGIGIAIFAVAALIIAAIVWFAVCAPRRRRRCTEKTANTAKPPTVSNTPMTCIVVDEKQPDAPQEVTAISQDQDKPKKLIYDKTEEKKKVSAETELRPRNFSLDSQQQRIADGHRVGRHVNPTMDDVKSDWGETVTKYKKEKSRDALPTETKKKKSEDLGSRSTITDENGSLFWISMSSIVFCL